MAVGWSRFVTVIAGALLAAGQSVAGAAEPAATVIVLDGSGSMWGTIDGRTKAELAREAVATVLDGLPAERSLGLLAYGHRRKGDCGDIELVVPPGPGSAEAVRAAVDGMRFLGKTPLTAAVRQAAEALRSTEAPATVVLVTDGLETCDADPCALGRELEASGVAFTAHVIGFGLSRGEGAEIACLAEATGGRYLAADDGAALVEALDVAVAAAEPEPPEPERTHFPGEPLMADVALEPTGQTVGPAAEDPPAPEFPADGTIAACRAACDAVEACAAWRFEPPGSYFVAEARCFLFSRSTEFDVRRFDPGEGWASGIKEGVSLLVRPYPATEGAAAE
jgi:Ca-activated chloride channel family protein